LKKWKRRVKMRKIKLALCFLDEEDKVIVKRPVEATWSVDVEKDLKEHHNIFVEDEIANIMTEWIKMNLKTDIVKEMITELKEL
jgi:hypothetical protein